MHGPLHIDHPAAMAAKDRMPIPASPPSPPAPSASHWVVFRLGHLGDVALSTGVLSYLAETRGWSFTCITRKAWADVFTGHSAVRSVIAMEERDLRTIPYLAACKRFAAAFPHSGLLDLHNTLRSRMLSVFWRGPVLRYPKMSLRRRFFLAGQGRAAGAPLRSTSVPQRYFLAVDSPPPPASLLLPRITLAPAEEEEARERLTRLFGPSSLPVALHPYAAHPLKTWPVSHWQTLAQLLSERDIPWISLGKGVPLFPGREEELSNKTSLRQSCALLSLCRVLVSGDSGPMHLAGAVGTPVVALFGPTTREWGFYPSGSNDIILETALPCRPCSLHGKKACRRAGRCLTDISPESAFKAIAQATGEP